MSNDLEAKCAEFVNELISKGIECDIKGHKDPHYSNFTQTQDGSYIVEGICNYCCGAISRPMTSKEYQTHINNEQAFIESLHKPVTCF